MLENRDTVARILRLYMEIPDLGRVAAERRKLATSINQQVACRRTHFPFFKNRIVSRA